MLESIWEERGCEILQRGKIKNAIENEKKTKKKMKRSKERRKNQD
jgi:hypothetical protein